MVTKKTTRARRGVSVKQYAAGNEMVRVPILAQPYPKAPKVHPFSEA